MFKRMFALMFVLVALPLWSAPVVAQEGTPSKKLEATFKIIAREGFTPKVKTQSADSINGMLGVPQVLTVSQDDYEKITLWWSSYTPDKPYIYVVYKGESLDGEYNPVGSTTELSFSDEVKCGETRYYFIVATNGGYESSWPSNLLEVHGFPCISTVKNVYAAQFSPGWPSNSWDVTIWWDANPSAIWYKVYRWKSGDTQIQEIAWTSWDWAQESIECGSTVVYWVSAGVGTFESKWSDPFLLNVTCGLASSTTPVPSWLPGSEKLETEMKVFIPMVASAP